jgi:hypothetical protein
MPYDYDDTRVLADMDFREAQDRTRQKRDLRDWHTWDAIDSTTAGPIVALADAEPINFGHELSTTQLIAARFGRRGRRG